MKKGLLIPLLALIWSCDTDSKSEDPLDQLSIQLDTVMIDTGDDIIDLRDNLYNAQLSEDNRYLYNLISYGDPSLEIIDLDELKLVRSSPLEKDGPNGIPEYLRKFYITNTGDLLLVNYRFYKIFNLDGKLVKDLALEKIAPDLLKGSDNYPDHLIEYSNDPNKKALVIYNWTSKVHKIIIFDLAKQSYREIPIEELDKLTIYHSKLTSNGNFIGGLGQSADIAYYDEKILFSSAMYNDVLVYDITKDTLYTKDLSTNLLGTKRTFTPPSSVEMNSLEMQEVIKSNDEEINYGKFKWDSKTKNYFRFSYKKYFNGEKDDWGYVSTRADVYLSIFDQDFNLLAEALIPELNKAPELHFIKDGKIWLFENMNDEVAFVRIDLSENNF